MNTLRYKGFQASVEYDDGTLFVRVLHIDDILIGECDSASKARQVFEEMIDEYLRDCEELGKRPNKPFSGTFNIRISSEAHYQAAMAATDEGLNLNAWVAKAISEKLNFRDIDRRVEDIFRQKQVEIDMAIIESLGATAQRYRPMPIASISEASVRKSIDLQAFQMLLSYEVDNIWNTH